MECLREPSKGQSSRHRSAPVHLGSISRHSHRSSGLSSSLRRRGHPASARECDHIAKYDGLDRDCTPWQGGTACTAHRAKPIAAPATYMASFRPSTRASRSRPSHNRLGEDFLPGPRACGYCEPNAKLLMMSATDIPSRGHRECCSRLRRGVLKATEYSQSRLGWIIQRLPIIGLDKVEISTRRYIDLRRSM